MVSSIFAYFLSTEPFAFSNTYAAAFTRTGTLPFRAGLMPRLAVPNTASMNTPGQSGEWRDRNTTGPPSLCQKPQTLEKFP